MAPQNESINGGDIETATSAGAAGPWTLGNFSKSVASFGSGGARAKASAADWNQTAHTHFTDDIQGQQTAASGGIGRGSKRARGLVALVVSLAAILVAGIAAGTVGSSPRSDGVAATPDVQDADATGTGITTGAPSLAPSMLDHEAPTADGDTLHGPAGAVLAAFPPSAGPSHGTYPVQPPQTMIDLTSSSPSTRPSDRPSAVESSETMTPTLRQSSSPSSKPSQEISFLSSPPSESVDEITTINPVDFQLNISNWMDIFDLDLTSKPSSAPTGIPTSEPTQPPSIRTTSQPTRKPTLNPTMQPIIVTSQPSFGPTDNPTSAQPSAHPTTSSPTSKPTNARTISPSTSPTTSSPTSKPTNAETISPSTSPTTSNPTGTPTVQERTYDAVIVGAGWSGLRAAQVLSGSGLSVLILEANDYVGGRSRTVRSEVVPGVSTDVGSEWLYTGSRMDSYLEKNGVIDGALGGPENTLGGSDIVYAQERAGGPARPLVDGDELGSRLWGDFLEFKSGLLKALGDVSYSDAFDKFVKEMGLGKEEEQYLNMVLDMGELNYAGESDHLSLEEINFYFMDDCYSDSHYLPVPEVGFGSVAALVADDLAADVRLSSKVVGVNYEGPDVIVSYENNEIKKEVVARAALITVSLGVLQAGSISFSPRLPGRKQNAIDSMGFGLLNKCTLYWKDRGDAVWPEDEYWFSLITPEDESSGMWTTFFNPTKLKGVPSLIGWISGDEARAMEDQTDEEIVSQVMVNLRSMFPDIKQPDEAIITRWGKEEHVKGSYSFNRVGRNFVDDAANLRERVGNVWFAGEATNTDGWQATTAGAWDTGEEAAKDMLSVLNK